MSGIDLDALRARWAQQDAQLQQSLKLDVALLRRRLADDGAEALRPIVRLTRKELYANLLATLLFGWFAIAHADRWHLLLSGLVPCLVWGLLTIDGIRQRRMLAAIDFGGPVAAVQQRLDAVSALRVRAAKWMAVVWPLLWIPVFVAGMQAVFGIDVTPGLDALFWLVNLLVFACWLLGLAIAARRLRARLSGSPLLQRVLDDVAGAGLRSARAFADELARVDEGDAPALDLLRAAPGPDAPALRRDVGDALQRMRRALPLRLVAKVALVVVSGLFLAAHGAEWRPTIMVPALVTHALLLATMIDDIVLRVLIDGIDLRAPLADLHAQIATLRRRRLWLSHAAAVALPLFALPVAVVVARGGLGIDLLPALPVEAWIGYAVFAAAWMPLVHVLLRRHARRGADTPAGAWVRRRLAGRALDDAHALLSAHLHRIE